MELDREVAIFGSVFVCAEYRGTDLELVIQRGYGLDKLMQGRAAIPHSHLPAGICYPSCAEWLTTTNHELGNGRLSCLVHLLLSVLGFDPNIPLGLGLFCLPVVCSGFPGYSSGRGVGPAGGAPGGD
ncbi:P-loop containing nucleoside triphosphate hydrolases superfamily protein isoform 1 [Dorcoceras hygrometricum]|uniref:P-loop containing nucleoside triphosphate hydrolases superfamily protein isoform 1 n=1 Tax=Dorcoceras hygrometricum TaxID=472368 RepID=A0A2Z7D996_9LAMI|nr:P-loop containing nucleoside triphosphate hydrolases superfamily protein isoform 1 [Dorcoceras hygrometricum]